MPILLEQDMNYAKQKMHRVRQNFDHTAIERVKEHLIHQLECPSIREKIKPEMKVAISVGSRGIGCLKEVVMTTVEYLKSLGAKPYILTAMGSHGGGTVEGQRSVLAEYGITELEIGAPVVSNIDVRQVGKTSENMPVYVDTVALEAEMVIVINRIKPHTDFDGEIESGLCKMLVIGLGNHVGCSTVHNNTPFAKFTEMLKEASAVVKEHINVGFGIAIVENAVEKPLRIEVIKPEQFVEKERELLVLAKEKMAKLYFPEIDLLIVRKIGKEISGNGMDPNVVGRYGPKAKAKDIPKIDKLIVMGLSEGTHGNAIGMGLADITTRQMFEQIDFESTYANCLAAKEGYEGCFIPLIMNNEEEAIAAAIKLWGGDPLECRIVEIESTIELETVLVSDALLPYIRRNNDRFTLLEEDTTASRSAE